MITFEDSTTPTTNGRRYGDPATIPPGRPADERAPRELPKWAILERQRHEQALADLRRHIDTLESELMTLRRASQERREAAYQADRAVALYGERAELTEIKQRVALHPTFADLPDQGKALVAQVSKALGVNPFMHLHAWVDKRGLLNITLDYKGLMFLAGEDNIMIDTERSHLLSRDEMVQRGIRADDIDAGAVAAVCVVIEIDKAARCKAAGITYHPVTGHAVFYPVQTKVNREGKSYTITNEPPNSRDAAWVAEKNALRAALYKISDLSLKLGRPVPGLSSSEDGWTAELPPDSDETRAPAVIEGEYSEQSPDAAPSPAPEQPPLFDAALESKPKTCTAPGCKQPGEDTPLGWLCKKHANTQADLEAAKS